MTGTIIKTGLKSRKIRIVLAVELLLLFAGIAGLFRPVEAVRIEPGQEGISLSSGVYNVRIAYSASEDGSLLNVVDLDPGGSNILFNPVNLFAGENTEDCQLWVLHATDQIRVEATGGSESAFRVYEMEIRSTNAECRIWIFGILCVSLLLNLLIFLRLYDRQFGIPMEKKAAWGILAMTVIVISIPSMTDYNIWGHDWGFHMLRVEGLIGGWKDGQFPVRIQGYWLKGYGYAASVFYSDLLLVPQALLRMLGFTIRTANNLYIIWINGLTVAAAYMSFRKCFEDDLAALTGAVFYATASYRIYDVYMRAALGESLAMIFLPMVLGGLYCLLAQDINTEKYRRNWVMLTVGLTGMIQSHVLTCEMLAFSGILLCVLLWRRIFRRETFLALVKTAVVTCLVNLWYLVPFLDYFLGGDINASHTEMMTFQNIQEWGTMPSHLLFLFPGKGARPVPTRLSMYETGSFTIGALLLLCVFVWAYLEFTGKAGRLESKERWTGRLLFSFTLLYFVLSSCYFPWDALQGLGGTTEKLILSLQFPYRFLTLACITAAGLACVLVKYMRKRVPGGVARGIAGVGILAACLFACYQNGQSLMHHGFARVYEKQGMGTMNAGNGEYLPYQTDLSLLRAEQIVCGSGVEAQILEKGRDTLHMRLSVCNQGEDSYVEVPLLYYRGYGAKDGVSGEKLDVTAGENNVVRILLPEEYAGEIEVAFRAPWHWRTAEWISLLSVITVFLFLIKRKVKEDKYGKRLQTL